MPGGDAATGRVRHEEEERSTMSAQAIDPRQLVAHLRPMLDRLDRATNSDIFTPSSFHPLCTTLGIAHSLRPLLWRMLVENGYISDAGNGAVCITEHGLQLLASPRAQTRSAEGVGKP
jgi:hypothetical protein